MATSTATQADSLINMLDGYKVSYALAVACQLEVFDKLDNASDAVDAVSFAQKHNWTADATERLLTALSSLDLVEKDSGLNPPAFRITESGKLLRKNADVTLWGYSQNLYRYANGFQKVPETVDPNWNVTKPEEQSAVLNVRDRFMPMHAMISLYSDALTTAFDLKKYKTVVDLGGGSGSMSYELCRKYPTMSLTVFDRQPVIEVAKSHFYKKCQDPRVSFKAGDFLQDDIPTADLYIIGHVVHDWKEEQMVDDVIAKVYRALNPGGAVLLMEKFLKEDKCGPVPVNMWDLQVMTLCAGKMRTASEYSSILKKHGFVNTEIRNIPGMCNYDGILGHKI